MISLHDQLGLCRWSPTREPDDLLKFILQLVDRLELEGIFLGIQCHKWWLDSRPHLTSVASVT